MISLVKVIVEYFSKLLGKRGELRNKDILLASKLSSSIRISEFLSSRVLLLKFRLKSYSDLFRVSMDPRVKPKGDGRESVPEGDGRESVPEGDGRESVPEGDGRESVPEGDGRESVSEGDGRESVPEGDGRECVPEGDGRECVPEGDNSLLSSLRGGRRGQAIFELGKNLTSLNLLLAKRRVVRIVILPLFLLFPFSSYSAIHFLPDAQSEEILSSPPIASIDSMRCEDIGYTYYSSGVCPPYHNQEVCVFHDKYLKCDGKGWCMDNSYTISSCTSPKIVDTQCPNGLSLYKYCVCPSTYKYACTGTGYSSGNGTVCDGKYTKCNCSTNYVWSGSACVCDSSFKYTCSGTGYSSGSGVSCGGKYKSCNCSTYYSWNGSACAHVHSYVCPSGYSTSKTGMVTPASAAKVCQLSGCSSTSGTCYKETHVHSYSCPSGYSTSNAGMAAYITASKSCSCGATSGTCYKSTHVHSYYCPSGSYTSASSCSAGTDGTVSKVCSCGGTSTETCYKCKHVHSYYCPSGSYTYASSCIDGTSGTVSKKCSCGATSGTCYKCAAHYCSYSCPSGSYESSSSCSYGTSGTTYKTCRCGATNSETCYTCNPPPHTHNYYCRYYTSTSGLVDPVAIDLECSCGLTKSGTCYKDNHSHDYSCPSGYSNSCSSSCSNGCVETNKVCSSCGYTHSSYNGTCKKCVEGRTYYCNNGDACEGLGGQYTTKNRCTIECYKLEDCTKAKNLCKAEATYYNGYCTVDYSGACGIDLPE